MANDAFAGFEGADREALDERGAFGGARGAQDEIRAHQVLEHASPTELGKLAADVGRLCDHVIQIGFGRHEHDAGHGRDHRGRARRSRQQRHFPEQSAAAEAGQGDRSRARFGRRLLHVELAARHEVRFFTGAAFSHEQRAARHDAHGQDLDHGVEALLVERREQDLWRNLGSDAFGAVGFEDAHAGLDDGRGSLEQRRAAERIGERREARAHAR